MTTIFFGPPHLQDVPGRDGGPHPPVAPVLCSAIVVCHLADRRRVTKP
ncbi:MULTISPECIES: hypothetical protein [Methylobacterium]|nr:hypothetical protein [Methylobacterium sp. DB0501]NGM37206.1 hypothetical protein [Methylobacterium sp. DB0501]